MTNEPCANDFSSATPITRPKPVKANLAAIAAILGNLPPMGKPKYIPARPKRERTGYLKREEMHPNYRPAA